MLAQSVSTPEWRSFEDPNGRLVIEVKQDADFIIGANRYVLYVGDQLITKHLNPRGEENILHFYPDPEQLSNLTSGNQVILSYGLLHTDNRGFPQIPEHHPNTFLLGSWK